MSEIKSLGEMLPEEIARNQELLMQYAQLPPQSSWLATTMIKADLAKATTALAEGDVVAMIQVYEKLKSNE